MKTLMIALFLISVGQLTGQVTVDFTDPSTPTWGTDARRIMNVNGTDIAFMWPGDADGDGKVIFQGAGSDIAPISDAVFTNPLNVSFEFSFPVDGYHPADLNLDGQVIFQGAGSELGLISDAVFSNPQNVTFEFSFPVETQLPTN